MPVRAVNGWGPRCACGGKSAVHIVPEGAMHGTLGMFLCETCITSAIRASYPDGRPPFWPGDEDRDEPYVDPRDITDTLRSDEAMEAFGVDRKT